MRDTNYFWFLQIFFFLVFIYILRCPLTVHLTLRKTYPPSRVPPLKIPDSLPGHQRKQNFKKLPKNSKGPISNGLQCNYPSPNFLIRLPIPYQALRWNGGQHFDHRSHIHRPAVRFDRADFDPIQHPPSAIRKYLNSGKVQRRYELW